LICIFSNSGDYSTSDVVSWLHYLGKKEVIRINYDDVNSDDSIQIDVCGNNFSFQVAGQVVYLKDIEAVWYRKGKNWLCDDLFYPVTVNNHYKFTGYLKNKLKNEETKLSQYLHYIIEKNVPVLGTAVKSELNKLIILNIAKRVNLLVPQFYITNTKESMQEITSQSSDLITKSLSDGLFLFEKTEANTGYFSYTEIVDKEKVNTLPTRFSPSFLQENIRKKFELRIFFIDNTCYAMAIFSQTDEKTKIDFRKYNEEKPNRYVPFKLPEEIDKKIKALFQILNLNTGSVDMIVDEKYDFYFLEINPVGQFGMVSQPCNYYLEKLIANYLIDNGKKRRIN
jgi:ATP-GRASP peptide maturase of grasp-with-spasm system